MTEGERFFVFFGVWIALGIASVVLLLRGSPEIKRQWFPRITIFAGVLFVAFIYWIAPVLEVLYLAIPAVALITYLNLKIMKFCPRCGAYYQTLGRLYRVNFCHKCGFALSNPQAPGL